MGSMTRRYAVVLEPGEDGWIVATVPAFPGCVTQGRTREEALVNAREALELTIEDMLDHGEPLPGETGAVEILEVAV
jgi:antitoxin HicB